MSAPMVRALLAGAKTQTRRVVKGRALEWLHPDMFNPQFVADPANALCPYGAPGDRLWVRETWNTSENVLPPIPEPYIYAADLNDHGVRRWAANWRPSIHMPRAASRILLEVTAVRAERLQSISQADALAEGIVHLPRLEGYGLPDGSHFHCTDPRISYWSLWDAINGQGSVEANPWVWAVSFRRTTP